MLVRCVFNRWTVMLERLQKIVDQISEELERRNYFFDFSFSFIKLFGHPLNVPC